MACGKLAASSMNSGARSPNFSFEFSLAIDPTLEHVIAADNTGRGKGTKEGSLRDEKLGRTERNFQRTTAADPPLNQQPRVVDQA
jgi:hypothetical protein